MNTETAAIDTEELISKYADLKVPQLTMIMMGVIMVLLIAVIVAGLVYIHRHFPNYTNAIFIGVIADLLFGYLIYGGLTYGLMKIEAVSAFFSANEAAYNSVLVVLSVILDSLAVWLGIRFLFRFYEKRHLVPNIGAVFTFGLSMYASSLLAGQQMTFALEYIMYGTMMNNIGMDAAIYQMITNGVTEEAAVESVTALIETSWLQFLWEGMSYVLKGLAETAAAVCVYGVMKKRLEKNWNWAVPVMILLYFIPTILNAALKAPGPLCIVLTVVFALADAVIAGLLIHKYMPEDEEDIKRKPLKRKHYTKNDPPEKMPKIVMPDD